ncbi:protein-disulfide reductase DsbD family protein [Endozoicomonas elysicola]|uniref:protein-disulfide reductase DsbD family protein n=1 Tax=Endozoicomonas elysicola TaxID=305900 RepID=UPI00047664EA|nr:protein-disulfide reductase DsbD domain-containing protein [Endozoicomonas elysicola]
MKHPAKPLATVLSFLSILLLSFLPFMASASEVSTGWLTDPKHPPLSVRLMLTGETDPQAKTVEGLLEVQLDGDWKTYWRSPGEGGVAPSLDWSKSENLNQVEWHWPIPGRYAFMGVETLGYKDRVVFPLTIHVNNMQEPVWFLGTLTMPSCTNICVLNDYELSLTFQPDQLDLSEQALHLYNQGISQVPRPSNTVEVMGAFWDQAKEIAIFQISRPQGWKNPDVFVDSSSDELKNFIFDTPNIRVNGDTITASFKVTNWLEPIDLHNRALPLVITDQNLATELQATLGNEPLKGLQDKGLLTIMVIALLGGLILNIMPCVLPVLGMKLSSVISTQGLEKQQIRGQFLASAAGILVSFWLLALFLAALKLSGQALGWGIQFQNPYFIGAMVLVTAVFAANMMGLFEIQLSSNTSTWLASKGDNSYAGHFIQGMFATLLATPCSAPFLGTAVAFALGADYIVLFLVFTALAIGMAIPWLLIASFPQLASLLPKPGRWMNTVKTLFGFMMLATSLWLLSLITSFVGAAATLIIGVIFVIGLLWRLGKTKGSRSVVMTLAFLSFVSAAGLLLSFTNGRLSPKPAAEISWQPLKTESIQGAVQQGKTVFVDITAGWCITCKANKVGVLQREPVYSQLHADNLIAMQGDWTQPSEYVTNFLQSYGRYGVPFNVVYGPGAPDGIELPVILTSDAVIKAIEQARGHSQ